MSRHGSGSDRITVASLIGTATRHARDRDLDEAAAVAELVELATERQRGHRPRLRVDLLAAAAGSLIGGHRYRPSTAWSHIDSARLLFAAGADQQLTEQVATETFDRLAQVGSRGGIGNPT